MAPHILTLPRDVRNRIYRYALCTQGPAQLIHPVMRDEKLGLESDDGSGLRFPEQPEPRYPPREADQEELGAKASGTAKNDPNSSTQMNKKAFESVLRKIASRAEHPGSGRRGGRYDDEDEDGGDTSDDEDYPWRRRGRYELAAFRRLDVALLQVNRQIHSEALPIFYGGTTFLIDCDGKAAIRFFRKVPIPARKAITSLALGGETLLADDAGVRWTWSGDLAHPKLSTPAPMVTPFGAFLATKLPKLEQLYVYVPYGGTEDFYCSHAPPELVHGSSSQKKALSKLRSMAKSVWVGQNPVWIDWKWGDRSIDMGSDGMVQAVIESRLMDQEECERQGHPPSAGVDVIMEDWRRLRS
ncbi:hypothetical protein LTR85_003835 [Meristemomyces frigidus]|nr:hypothetical protein LTR85_003835 [Meristemomyces frigidus]